MAGNAVIGALRVVLGADTAQLETGLKSASSQVTSFASTVKKTLAGLGIGASLAGIGMALKGAVDEADKFGKAAQKWGVPVEELSRLSHAAKLSDVSLEGLGTGLSKLARNMSEVAGGASNTASKAFEALKISVESTPGVLKSNSEVMTEVAEKFSKMQDGAGKTALAMAIFGKSGAELIPMLNAGKAGLQEMMEEADKLGITIDLKTAKAAEAFNDNITRLQAATRGLILQGIQPMLPMLENLSTAMVNAVKDSETMEAIQRGLTSVLKGTATAGFTLVTVFQRLGRELGALHELLSTPIFNAPKITDKIGEGFDRLRANIEELRRRWGGLRTDVEQGPGWQPKIINPEFTAAFERFKAVGKETESAIANIGTTVDDFFRKVSLAPLSLEGVRTAIYGKLTAPIIASAEAAKNAMAPLEAFFLAGTKRRATMEAELQTIGLSAGAQEELKFRLQALNIAKEKQITLTDALRAKIDGEAAATGMLAERLSETRERYSEFQSQVQSVRSSLEGTFVDAITGAKSFKDAIGGLIKDLGRLAAQSAFRSIFGGSAAWGSAAGAAFNAGGGLFSGIGKLVGFAQGGSFEVGGSGGIDSQVRALRLTPGEQVNVTKGDQMTGGRLDVRVSLDNEMLRAVVVDESGRVVARAAPHIVSASVAKSRDQVAPVMSQYQTERGGEYRA